MAPDRRSRRSRTNRWYRQNVGGQQEIVIQDTIAGDRLRRVLDSYCPFCATNIRSVGPRNIGKKSFQIFVDIIIRLYFFI